jgi:hypothetical protein|tara:strand:+ start:551 stop:835 length:285 start_codon:yes stop_codon:yes gene_type:complete
MKKYIDGILVDCTAEDIAQYNIDQANAPTELQRLLSNLRETRNSLLARTDWTANSDLTMSSAMATYRQQLRDAPTGLTTVAEVEAYEFPTEVLS